MNRHSDQGVNATITSGGATPASVTSSSQKMKRGRKLKPKNSPATTESIKKKKRGRKNVQENQTTATASTSDEDEECSAANCVRPAGKSRFVFFSFFFVDVILERVKTYCFAGREVDWVQCDGGCNKWYHMYCVGLVKNQIKADEDFVCKKCKKVSKTMAEEKDNCDRTNDDNTPKKPTQIEEDEPDDPKNNKSQTTTTTTTNTTPMDVSDTEEESHTKKK